ncbi:hypothetical protein scyTo_0010887 [Scyliorhinus torazame]|uniref:Uncharacterized protein n=1 Tax=Scyliorhinus torazame TaxID=75743 RepID=A0A401PCU6_SCYTO|nr:hypothetical protein [Scyliorhinus torazame]
MVCVCVNIRCVCEHQVSVCVSIRCMCVCVNISVMYVCIYTGVHVCENKHYNYKRLKCKKHKALFYSELTFVNIG